MDKLPHSTLNETPWQKARYILLPTFLGYFEVYMYTMLRLFQVKLGTNFYIPRLKLA